MCNVVDPVGFYRARTIDDACACLAEYGDDARVVNGGTALAILMRQELVHPALLIGVGGIPELRRIEPMADGGLRIGAAVKLRVAEHDARLKAGWPVVAEAISVVATPRIRNMATIGGGLAHADPAQDPPIALSAAGANVVVRAGAVERRIPASDFCTGYYENALEPGEVVTGVELPPPAANSGGKYWKFLPRSVEDYGVVTAAATVTVDDNNVCTRATLALGAVSDTPVTIDVSDLIGQTITEAVAKEAAQRVRERVDPSDDVRGSAAYKREMAVVFARRALFTAAQRARGQGTARA